MKTKIACQKQFFFFFFFFGVIKLHNLKKYNNLKQLASAQQWTPERFKQKAAKLRVIKCLKFVELQNRVHVIQLIFF